MLTATGFVNGIYQFSTHRIHTPVGGPYGCAKFGANLLLGVLGKWVKYNDFYLFLFFIYTFSLNSPTGQTRFSRLMAQTTRTRVRVCLLEVRCYCFSFWKCIPPKTHILKARINVYEPNWQNIESFILL